MNTNSVTEMSSNDLRRQWVNAERVYSVIYPLLINPYDGLDSKPTPNDQHWALISGINFWRRSYHAKLAEEQSQEALIRL